MDNSNEQAGIPTTEKITREFEDVITCPYCEAIQGTESEYCHTTINGTFDEGKFEEQDCEDCGMTFLVQEMISRSWKTIPKPISSPEPT